MAIFSTRSIQLNISWQREQQYCENSYRWRLRYDKTMSVPHFSGTVPPKNSTSTSVPLSVIQDFHYFWYQYQFGTFAVSVVKSVQVYHGWYQTSLLGGFHPGIYTKKKIK